MVKTQTKIDYSTLKYCIENNIFKPFVLYTKIKACYNHSIIYNYNPNKLAKLTGLHHKTITRYVKKLIQHNLAELHHGNLLFKKPLYKKGTKFLYIETRPWITFNEIKERIETLLLHSNAIMQSFNIYGKCGKNRGNLSERQKRKARKHFSKLNLAEIESNPDILFTTRGIGRLFNFSHSTAANMLKKLTKRKYIKTSRRVDLVDGNLFDNTYFGHIFLCNNKLWIDRGITIRFLI